MWPPGFPTHKCEATSKTVLARPRDGMGPLHSRSLSVPECWGVSRSPLSSVSCGPSDGNRDHHQPETPTRLPLALHCSARGVGLLGQSVSDSLMSQTSENTGKYDANRVRGDSESVTRKVDFKPRKGCRRAIHIMRKPPHLRSDSVAEFD